VCLPAPLQNSRRRLSSLRRHLGSPSQSLSRPGGRGKKKESEKRTRSCTKINLFFFFSFSLSTRGTCPARVFPRRPLPHCLFVVAPPPHPAPHLAKWELFKRSPPAEENKNTPAGKKREIRKMPDWNIFGAANARFFRASVRVLVFFFFFFPFFFLFFPCAHHGTRQWPCLSSLSFNPLIILGPFITYQNLPSRKYFHVTLDGTHGPLRLSLPPFSCHDLTSLPHLFLSLCCIAVRPGPVGSGVPHV